LGEFILFFSPPHEKNTSAQTAHLQIAQATPQPKFAKEQFSPCLLIQITNTINVQLNHLYNNIISLSIKLPELSI